VTTVVSGATSTDEGGALVVRWEVEPPGAPVDIAVGTAPDAIDHDHPLHAGVTTGEVRLPLVPGERRYVSVAPTGGGAAVVTAERRVALRGALNVRDLGGYPTSSGRRTSWGRLFRADALHALEPDDVESLTGLGLRVVYDLRRDSERDRSPNVALGGDVRSVVLAMGGAAAESTELMDQVMAGEVTSIDEGFMVDVYAELIGTHAADFGTLLAGLAEPGGLPALFHCTAGKDRTGLASAMVLSVLGVERATILDDYELSNRYRASVRVAQLRPVLAEAGVDVERILPLLTAPRPVLEASLAALDAQHGGVEPYLLGPAGMRAEQLDDLREALLR
jgi:protein-tyrosine phosphatase